MSAKKYLYAAVGAQVAVARSAQSKFEDLVSRVNENATSASSDLKSRIDVWAGEGEQFLGKVTDTKAIDDLTSKVDFDQVQSQVNRLRDQLEDIVATWRANFRPESKPVEKVAVTQTPAASTAPAARATTAKQPVAKKPAAKKPAAKSTTAKATTAKATAAKKPAAKSTTSPSTATKKPAAKSTTANPTAQAS